jgi:2-desacetyl-2-hydroxyethyl bacteriochlorophyllide A dehydrogenase
MRAALLETPGHVVMTEAPMPTIQGADEVLIQVRTVGVCGSEVHAFHGSHPYRIAPVVLGHEVAGDIVAVGEAVTDFTVGDRVVVDPQWICGECTYCRTGYINHCQNKRVLGTPAWPGGFGEYILAQENAVFHLPESLSYKQGSLIEPLTVDVHVVKQAKLMAGESVAILGTGSIGGLLSGVCRVVGADPIIAADVRQHCLDAARERLGATHDFLLPDEGFVDKVKEVTGGEGVDVTFVTADDVSLVNRAVEMTKPRGRIVLVALLRDAPLQLMAYDIIGKELHIIGSTMTHHADMQEAIELAASGQVDVEAIATHVLPIEEAQRGMELVDTKDDGAIKVTLTFS